MKRLCLLAGMVLLLSACPDTKLPTPKPKVPEPKAAATLPAGFTKTPTAALTPPATQTLASLPS